MALDEQAEGERAIFAEFVRAAHLPVRLGSITSRPSPEPDIRCEVEGEGPVAFELGEVVSPALEQATSERVAARLAFRSIYEALPGDQRSRLDASLGGPPAVFVAFPAHTSPGRWRHAVGPILTALVDRSTANAPEDRLREGELPVWLIPSLRRLVAEVLVQRSTGGPFLGVMEMTEHVDATQRLLSKKFTKHYRTDAPIELLAYFEAAPRPRDPDWQNEALGLIRAGLPQSPFRRVWLFDWFTLSAIAHPPRSGPTGP